MEFIKLIQISSNIQHWDLILLGLCLILCPIIFPLIKSDKQIREEFFQQRLERKDDIRLELDKLCLESDIKNNIINNADVAALLYPNVYKSEIQKAFTDFYTERKTTEDEKIREIMLLMGRGVSQDEIKKLNRYSKYEIDNAQERLIKIKKDLFDLKQKGL